MWQAPRPSIDGLNAFSPPIPLAVGKVQPDLRGFRVLSNRGRQRFNACGSASIRLGQW